MAHDPSGHAASYVHAGAFVVFADHISKRELVRLEPGIWVVYFFASAILSLPAIWILPETVGCPSRANMTGMTHMG